MELAWLQVPGGWWWVPNPVIPVAGRAVISALDKPLKGTPRASPMMKPIREPLARWCFSIILNNVDQTNELIAKNLVGLIPHTSDMSAERVELHLPAHDPASLGNKQAMMFAF